MNKIIVSKFGGGLRADEGALADSEKVKQAAEILYQNPDRRFAVISAPGSPSEGNIKITDMLYVCQSLYKNRENFQEVLDAVISRYRDIVDGLGIDFNLEPEINSLKRSLFVGKVDQIVSHGEMIMAKIFAAYIGWPFIDAIRFVNFKNDGTLDEQKTFSAAYEVLGRLERAVIPGFYGVLPNGNIKTFPRGGSDITGAIIARALNADLYEKWTEKSKIYVADPNVVDDAKTISKMTYNEMRELSHMGGVNMIHENVIFLLQDVKIPIRVKNVNIPDFEGTLISSDAADDRKSFAACIAGNRNFKVVKVKKFGMSKVPGIGARIFNVLSRHNIPFEHCLSGIDSISVVLKSPKFDLRRREIQKELEDAIQPDSFSIEKDLSIIAVIGEGMGTVKGTFSKVFKALADASIKVRMIDQGSDDLNILLGVYDEDFEEAVRALYKAIDTNS